MVKVEFLFGNHKFWQNTKRRHNLEGGWLLGSTLMKRNMAIANLSDIHVYCNEMSTPFDKTLASTIAHEVTHLMIMDEVETTPSAEEWIISKLVHTPQL